jgi:hypothetical protein
MAAIKYTLYGPMLPAAARLVSVSVLFGLMFSLSCSGLPAKVQTHLSSSLHRTAVHRPSDSLWTIVRDFEDAVFRLKEYALQIDLETADGNAARKDSSDVDLESYPEIVSELQTAKKAQLPPADRSQGTKVSTSQKSSSGDQAAASAAGGGGAAQTVDSATNEQEDGDISLREALEFLVTLAKQKKQQRRDHDIPFP